MKRFSFLTLLFLGLITSAFSQLVVTDPPLPVSNQAVSVVFDATLGDGGLAGYMGDVYAHTGMITENSTSGSDWKYVKTSWGQNSADTKMSRIGPDLYQLDIGPDIREYYGVPGNEEILQMAFVFRSGVEVGGSYLTGKTESNGDIFVDVYEEGLSVSITKPALHPTLLELNDTLIVEISANDSDTIAYYNNGSFVKEVAGTILTDTIIADQYGKFWLKAIATNDGGEAVDSIYYFVRSEVVVEDLPAGIRNGINYLDGSTVVLCLPAPGKEYIFVIGDFSVWELGDDTYMKQTPDGERFWLEISGLESGKEYVYQYLIDGGLKIADPYSDKISDPWNDQYIDDETYPGLIAYPDGKTDGIASVLQTNQAEYNWEVTNFTPPAVEDLVIYELLVRDFTEKHSYQAVIDTLDYLEKLGVNVVELMPVNEFEGNISWGYNPSFYFAPDKYYGPREKLKELIDECHKRGMAVLIDLVLNHSFGQSPFVQMYFDGSNPTEDSPWYNVHSNFLNPDAQWGYDFNHESSYTQDLVDSVNSYWMSEYKFDGFRFDFTKGFSNNIKGSNDPWGSIYDADRVRLLKRMADEIWARKPNAIISFEHLAENSEEQELAEYGILMWGNMNHEYGESAMGYPSNLSYIDYKKRGWDVPHSLGYMHSHDEERLAYKCYQWGNVDNPDHNIKDTTVALERLQSNAMFFLTVPGPKMLWQFEELGYDYSIDYNGRTGPKPVRWDYYFDWRRKYLYDFYSSLINLRNTYQEVFQTDDYDVSLNSYRKRIRLRHETMNVIVVGNFGVEEGTLTPGFPHTGTWYDYFTGESIEVTDLEESMILQEGETHLYTDVELTTPEIGTDINENKPATGNSRVFPNPSNGQIMLAFELESREKLDVSLLDLNGRKLSDLIHQQYDKGLHEIHLNLSNTLQPGIYLLDILSGQAREVHKLVIH